ncbi:hypothetical protein ABPG77_000891 [Micractinium sp. CCAP 211/92]
MDLRWPPNAAPTGFATAAALSAGLALFAALRLLLAGREKRHRQQAVDLSGRGLGDAGLAAVAARLLVRGSHCRSLDLRRNALSIDSAALLARTLPRSPLERLSLGGNPRLGDKGAAVLSQGLRPRFLRHGSQLRALDLSGCDIRDAGAAALARSLSELSLADNVIDIRGAAALATALEKSPALRRMDLGSNFIQKEGAALLGRALRRRKNGLQNNELGDAGVAALCAGLRQHASELEWLDLSDNGLGPACCKALAELLQGCTSLRALRVHSNAIGDSGVCQIAGALRAKRRLQRLDLTGCGIGPAGARALAASALYDLLCTAPSLVVLDLRDNEFDEEGLRQLRKWGLHNRLAQLEGSDRIDPELCMLLLD